MNNHDPKLGAGRTGSNPAGHDRVAHDRAAYQPAAHEPNDPTRAPDNGRGGYVLLAAVAGAALIGGVLYFGMPRTDVPEQAVTPAPIERTLTDTPVGPNALPAADRPASLPMPADPAAPAPTAPQE